MNRYPGETRILVAVDCIIFGFDGNDIKLLLVQRGLKPERGKWSLMGGFLREEESLEQAANRILKRLTGIEGVYMAATMGSETTAAAAGQQGVVRRDPFAMLPFCGYNMGDYFAHWLSFVKRTDRAKLPKIYFVNWFRKSADGKFLWPGYGENSRVLKWICERIAGTGKAQETPIGNLPTPDALDSSGLIISSEDVKALTSVDKDGWKNEIEDVAENYKKFGSHLPATLSEELDKLRKRLG